LTAEAQFGRILKAMGEGEMARITFERIHAARVATLGREARLTLQAELSVIDLMLVMGDVEPGLIAANELVATGRRVLGPDDVFSEQAEALLAGGLTLAGRPEEAIEIYDGLERLARERMAGDPDALANQLAGYAGGREWAEKVRADDVLRQQMTDAAREGINQSPERQCTNLLHYCVRRAKRVTDAGKALEPFCAYLDPAGSVRDTERIESQLPTEDVYRLAVAGLAQMRDSGQLVAGAICKEILVPGDDGGDRTMVLVAIDHRDIGARSVAFPFDRETGEVIDLSRHLEADVGPFLFEGDASSE
jgi:hypothetical protein